MRHLVYVIIPDDSNFIKLGMWTSCMPTLRSRYNTVYPTYVMIVVEVSDARLAEAALKLSLRGWHRVRELYHKADGFEEAFLAAVAQLVDAGIAMLAVTYPEAERDSKAARARRRQVNRALRLQLPASQPPAHVAVVPPAVLPAVPDGEHNSDVPLVARFLEAAVTELALDGVWMATAALLASLGRWVEQKRLKASYNSITFGRLLRKYAGIEVKKASTMQLRLNKTEVLDGLRNKGYLL